MAGAASGASSNQTGRRRLSRFVRQQKEAPAAEHSRRQEGGRGDRPAARRSELDAHAGGRVDRLGLPEAVRQTGVNIRFHHAGVDIDALDGPPIDQKEMKSVEPAHLPLLIAANGECLPVGLGSGGGGDRAGRGGGDFSFRAGGEIIVVLVQVIEGADQVELGVDCIFSADPEEVRDPGDIVRGIGDPLGRPKFRRAREGRGDRPGYVVISDGLEAVRIGIVWILLPNLFVAAVECPLLPLVFGEHCEAGVVRQRRRQVRVVIEQRDAAGGAAVVAAAGLALEGAGL